MPKKKDRNRAGPRTIPAHWQAPQGVATATVPQASLNPGDWPLGPCWATRIDHSGSQGVFLTRQRPWGGSLTAVGGVVNDLKGLTDGMGDHAVAPARLRERVAEMGHPGHQVYDVPPEYVRFRLAQGEALSQRAGTARPVPFQRTRHLLTSVDAAWAPDLAEVEERLHRPDLLDRTALLVYAVEFADWRAAPDDEPAAVTFLAAVDEALKALEEGGWVTSESKNDEPDLDALSETETMAVPWPLTEDATQLVEALFGEHLEQMVTREVADRHQERLLHMAYLTDQAGQAAYSGLIATAAWSLRPDAEMPLVENPFVRALMRKPVEHHLLGGE